MMHFDKKKTLCNGPLRKLDTESHTFQGELIHYEVVSPCIHLSLVTEGRLAGTFDIVEEHPIQPCGVSS